MVELTIKEHILETAIHQAQYTVHSTQPLKWSVSVEAADFQYRMKTPVTDY